MGTKTVRLDAEAEKTLTRLRNMTGLSISEVLKHGLSAYERQALEQAHHFGVDQSQRNADKGHRKKRVASCKIYDFLHNFRQKESGLGQGLSPTRARLPT